MSKTKQVLINKAPGAFEKEYTLTGKPLGQGAYASVEVGIHKTSGEKVAIKILNKLHMKPSDVKKVHKEVGILATLRHKNVVRVLNAYEEKERFLIAMEFVGGGELLKKILDEEIFTEDRIRVIIKTIAEALQYCKNKGVVHRDIKPENILLTAEEEGGEIKVVDFNLSRVFEDEEITFSVMETQCGTPNYVAPEVISGLPYDFKCDIWSLGVIFFLLLSGGYLPFYVDDDVDDERAALLGKVREGIWVFEPRDVWDGVSTAAKDLLSKMMKKDPQARVDYAQLLAHPWFKSSEVGSPKIKLEQMAALNEKRRMLSAAATKSAVDQFKKMMEPETAQSAAPKPNPFNSSFEG